MSQRPPQAGPPLVAPAIVALALSIAAVIVFGSAPRPGDSGASAAAYFAAHATRTHVVGFLVAGTAMALAVWTATLYRRLRRLGVTAPGAAIALIGGTLACGSSIVSGLVTWVSAVSGEPGPRVDAPLARVLVDLAFAAGGPGFTAPLALLIAGAAVPIVVLRLAPRGLGWIGLVLAVAGVLSTGALLTSALDLLLPITRFGGLVWLIAVSLVLPMDRHRIRTGPAPESALA